MTKTKTFLSQAQINVRQRLNNGETVEISIVPLYGDNDKYPDSIAINGHHPLEDCYQFYAADLRRANKEEVTQDLMKRTYLAAVAILNPDIVMVWAKWVNNDKPINGAPMPFYFTECPGTDEDALPYTICKLEVLEIPKQ